MNYCSENENKLSALVCHSLDDHEADLMHTHLATCEGCMELYMSLVEAQLEVEETEIEYVEKLSDQQRNNILQKAAEIDKQTQHNFFGWQSFLRVAAVLCVTAAIAGAVLLPAIKSSLQQGKEIDARADKIKKEIMLERMVQDRPQEEQLPTDSISPSPEFSLQGKVLEYKSDAKIRLSGRVSTVKPTDRQSSDEYRSNFGLPQASNSTDSFGSRGYSRKSKSKILEQDKLTLSAKNRQTINGEVASISLGQEKLKGSKSSGHFQAAQVQSIRGREKNTDEFKSVITVDDLDISSKDSSPPIAANTPHKKQINPNHVDFDSDFEEGEAEEEDE